MKYLIPFIAVILIGCSTTAPAINEYTILPAVAPTPDISKVPLSPLSLRICTSRTVPSLASKNLYYLREEGQIGEYLYSRWSDAPASLIERALSASIQEKQLFATLLSSTSSANAQRLLESDLYAFYHRFHSDGTSEGYLDITYRLIDAQTKQPIAAKRFQITVQAKSNDASGGVEALSEATRRLSNECTLWLAGLAQKR